VKSYFLCVNLFLLLGEVLTEKTFGFFQNRLIIITIGSFLLFFGWILPERRLFFSFFLQIIMYPYEEHIFYNLYNGKIENDETTMDDTRLGCNGIII